MQTGIYYVDRCLLCRHVFTTQTGVYYADKYLLRRQVFPHMHMFSLVFLSFYYVYVYRCLLRRQGSPTWAVAYYTFAVCTGVQTMDRCLPHGQALRGQGVGANSIISVGKFRSLASRKASFDGVVPASLSTWWIVHLKKKRRQSAKRSFFSPRRS